MFDRLDLVTIVLILLEIMFDLGFSFSYSDRVSMRMRPTIADRKLETRLAHVAKRNDLVNQLEVGNLPLDLTDARAACITCDQIDRSGPEDRTQVSDLSMTQ